MTSAISAHWVVRTGLATAASMALVGLTACKQASGGSESAAAGEPPPAQVTTAQVQLHPVQQWDSFNGRIAAKESVEIRPHVGGYIDSVSFSEGQAVRKGQVLFTIDARPYKTTLASAQAQLQRAKAAQALANPQDRRARDLLVDRAISAEEADNRAGTLAQTSAEVMAAEAAVAAAQLDLGFTEVRSPITGVAGRAVLTAGNLAQANQSVLSTVVSQNPVYVYFDADEQSLLRSRQQAVTAKSEAKSAGGSGGAGAGAAQVRIGLANEEGFPHTGQVGFTDNRLDPQTGTLTVRATLANDRGLFTPGMFARVQMQGRALLGASWAACMAGSCACDR